MAAEIGLAKVLLEATVLAWDAGKTLFGPVADAVSRAPYKILESFTTLELEQNGDAGFVQDRVVRFIRNHEVPCFLYSGDGNHFIDELIVDGTAEPFSYVDREVRPKKKIEYPKGTQASVTLRAHSTGSYPGDDEWYETHVIDRIAEIRLVIVFPETRPPKGNISLGHRRSEGRPWTATRSDRSGTRYTTRGRRAFYWEARYPKVGSAYRVTWKW
jgi:hypothetical protein